MTGSLGKENRNKQFTRIQPAIHHSKNHGVVLAAFCYANQGITEATAQSMLWPTRGQVDNSTS